ncbi:MAG: hypothetical protein AAFU85_16710 [Planctomycetota bacterium]
MLALRAFAFFPLLLPLTASAQTTLRLLPAQGELATVPVEDIEKESVARETAAPSQTTDIRLKSPGLKTAEANAEPRTTLELKPHLELRPAFLDRPRAKRPSPVQPLQGRSLMTVQVEDVEELPAPVTDLLDSPTPSQPAIQPSRPSSRLTDAARRQQAMAAQLARLRTPMGNLHVTGLASNADRPPNQAMAVRVSQQGFTSTVITGNEHFGPDLPRTSTPYLRRHLFFEDAPLERLGESGGNLPTGWWTNPRSFAKFTLDTVRFPLRVWIDRPDQLVVRQAK